MNLFINEGVCRRRNQDNIKIEKLSDSRLKLSIRNYLDEERWEYVSFIIPGVTSDSLENDILLKNVSLTRAGKNKYYISISEAEEKHTYIYALLRSAEGIDDDVFIPRSMKEEVEVYRKLRFMEYDDDYNSYFSNLYFVKIRLDEGERIPVYFSYGERSILKSYHSFYRPRWDGKCHVSEKMKTLIFLDKYNFGEYISLSKL